MRLTILAISLLLAGCTNVERMFVLTSAVNCNVTRGTEQGAQGEADVDVLTQSGRGSGVFAGALVSRIECRDGTTVEATLDGSIPDPAPEPAGDSQ